MPEQAPLLEYLQIDPNQTGKAVRANEADLAVAKAGHELYTKSLAGETSPWSLPYSAAVGGDKTALRAGWMRFTGTLAGAFTVNHPASKHRFVAENQTTQQLTIKTPSGTGVNIASGETRDLYCDGTNVISYTQATSPGGIDALTDVDTTTTPPNDGDVLTWDAGNSEWAPAAPTGGPGGAVDFIDLGDVPASYTGQGSKLVAVKAAEDGLEFVSNNLTTLPALTDVTITAVQDEDYLKYDSGTGQWINFPRATNNAEFPWKGLVLPCLTVVATPTPANVSWVNTVSLGFIDTEGIFNVGTPTTITLGSTIRRARARVQLVGSGNATARDTTVTIKVAGAPDIGAKNFKKLIPGFLNGTITVSTPVFNGDADTTIQVEVTSSGGNIAFQSEGSFLEVEIIESSTAAHPPMQVAFDLTGLLVDDQVIFKFRPSVPWTLPATLTNSYMRFDEAAPAGSGTITIRKRQVSDDAVTNLGTATYSAGNKNLTLNFTNEETIPTTHYFELILSGLADTSAAGLTGTFGGFR